MLSLGTLTPVGKVGITKKLPKSAILKNSRRRKGKGRPGVNLRTNGGTHCRGQTGGNMEGRTTCPQESQGKRQAVPVSALHPVHKAGVERYKVSEAAAVWGDRSSCGCTVEDAKCWRDHLAGAPGWEAQMEPPLEEHRTSSRRQGASSCGGQDAELAAGETGWGAKGERSDSEDGVQESALGGER